MLDQGGIVEIHRLGGVGGEALIQQGIKGAVGQLGIESRLGGIMGKKWQKLGLVGQIGVADERAGLNVRVGFILRQPHEIGRSVGGASDQEGAGCCGTRFRRQIRLFPGCMGGACGSLDSDAVQHGDDKQADECQNPQDCKYGRACAAIREG